jgi:type IV pilus assembly protein PilO
MASAGFVADFAKKPPQYKAIVFGGIALVLGFMYFKFGYSPLKQKLVQARQDNEEMLSRSQRMDDDMKKFKELRTRMEQLQKIIDENQKALPSESELPAFFETLNRKVTEAGVEVRKWNRKKEENLGQFIKVPVDVEITGTFFQIKRFMASLVQRDVQLGGAAAGTESRERVVSIEDLSLTEPTVKNREIVMVAKFVASTYRQEDKTAAGAKPGAAPGAPAAAGSAAGAKPAAGAGSAAGSGSGAAPANSGMITSQPAQVKANVNESIDKGDARNRAGTGPETATPAAPAAATPTATPTPTPAPAGTAGKGGN